MGSRRTAAKGSMSDLSMEDIKEALLPSIRSAMKADMEEVFKSVLGDRLDWIEARLEDLAQLQQVVTDLRKSTADTSERMDDLLKVTIPALAKHFEDVTSALVMRQLDQDVHRRKWSLTIQGLPGEDKEDEGDTRRACIDFAKAHLGLTDASERDFAACHRLNQRIDAGIIARFTDLQQRDRWLLGARSLKNSDRRISISPDLPPVVRPLKKELLEKKTSTPTGSQIKGPYSLLTTMALCWTVYGQRQGPYSTKFWATHHRAKLPGSYTVICPPGNGNHLGNLSHQYCKYLCY